MSAYWSQLTSGGYPQPFILIRRGVSSTTLSARASPVSGSAWSVLLSESLISVFHLLLCPCQVGPLVLLYLIHIGVVLVRPLRCVGDPHLVTLEYLCSTALPTTCPATVCLPIAQLIGRNLDKILLLIRLSYRVQDDKILLSQPNLTAKSWV